MSAITEKDEVDDDEDVFKGTNKDSDFRTKNF